MPFLDKSMLQRPQVNLARSSPARMWFCAACAALAVIQSSLSDGFASMWVAVGALAGALLAETCFCYIRKNWTYKDGSVFVTSMVLALLLPNRINPFIAAAGGFFAIAVIKYTFGELGSNWLNPALGGALFIRAAWPQSFAQALADSPLEMLKQSILSFDTPSSPMDFFTDEISPTLGKAASFLNDSILSILRIKIPQNYLTLAAGAGSGIIADRALLALLAGSVVLLAVQACKVWIPVLFLTVFLLFTSVWGNVNVSEASADILFAMSSGGTMLTAFFLLPEPSTAPKAMFSTVCYVVLAAALGFVFRFFLLDSYGAPLAVALLNGMVPLVRRFETSVLYTRGGGGRPGGNVTKGIAGGANE
jgi:electron transport complex protein RnfD